MSLISKKFGQNVALPQRHRLQDEVKARLQPQLNKAVAGLQAGFQHQSQALQAARAAVTSPRFLGENLRVSTGEMAQLKQLSTDVNQAIASVGAGDWRGALQSFEKIHAAAPEVAQRLGQVVLNQLTGGGVQAQLQAFGLTPPNLPSFGGALPHALDAAVSVNRQDWKGALDGLAQISRLAPALAEKLGPQVMALVPPEVQQALGSLGLTAENLGKVALPPGLGASLAPLEALLGTTKALQTGDWQAAAANFAHLPQLPADLAGKLGQALGNLMPAPLKEGLAKLGLTPQSLAGAGDAAGQLLGLAQTVAGGVAGKTLGDVSALLGSIGNPDLKQKLAAGVESALGMAPGALANALQTGVLGNVPLFGAAGQSLFQALGNPLANTVNYNGLTLPQPLAAALSAAGTQTLASGSVSLGGQLFQARGEWGNPSGPFYAQGSVALGQAVLQAQGSVSANLKNLTFNAQGTFQSSIYAVNAQGQIQARTPLGLTQVGGYAQVGANLSGAGSVAIDPMHGTLAARLGVDAFVGARAGVSLNQTLGPVSAGMIAKAAVGVGVKFDADVGFQKGKFTAKFNIGAALGIGFEIGFKFSVDFNKIGKSITDGIKGLGKAAGRVFKGVGAAVGWLGGQAKKVGQAAQKAVKAVGSAAKAVGNAVSGAVKSVGSAVKKLFKKW